MDRVPHRRRRVLLGLLVALGVLWPAQAAFGQDAGGAGGAATPAACKFTKPEAIKANGGPLGNSIWGRLCQLKDSKPTYPNGVKITVFQGEKAVGSDTTAKGGIFVVEIPANGVYRVVLDTKTLPKGFSLTDEKRATLSDFPVKFGDQQATFRMGADRRGAKDFSYYATIVAKGFRLGLILAVASMGLSLVFGVTGLTNFAHAELVTLGAIGTLLVNRAGVPFWLSVPVGVGIGVLLGVANDRGIWRPLRKRRMALLSMMVVSIGLSTAVRNLIQAWYGPDPDRYELSGRSVERKYGPFSLTPNDLLIIAICLVVIAAMVWLLRRTRLGTAIRAVADNPDLAASSGIAVDRIITVVWALCGGLAALGGVLYGLTLNVKFDMGFTLLLAMFAAVVLGGLGSAYGAVLGAVVIGVVQETSGVFIDTAYKFVVALLVLVIVLVIRPQGILGQRERFG